MRFKLISNKQPMPFTLPEIVELDPFWAEPGRRLVFRAYEHPKGPFQDWVWVEYHSSVVSVEAVYDVSNKQGLTHPDILPRLTVEFV